MNDEKLTREELIQKIEEFENWIAEFKRKEEEEITLEFPWTGNLGHWYWNYQTNEVVFNPLKVTTLGYEVDEIPEKVDYQFFTERLHPEDYERVMNDMVGHLRGELPVYETEYRIQTKDGNWRWYLDMGKVTQRDEEGKPLFLAGIVFDTTDRHELLDQIEEKNQLLSKLAITDGLTQLLNHQAIYQKLEEEIKRNKRYESKLAVLLVDIDHFKRINDNYGHQQGDLVLAQVAVTLNRSVREIDIVGRYGGEEFLIIFPNTNVKEAHNAAERIRKEVEKMVFPDGFSVTISGGVAEYQAENVLELVEKADKQLYRAKDAGRNKIMSQLI
jgi:diguanylate cyclase (GGDEF)-like protein/PAS domain S-box-containing protein